MRDQPIEIARKETFLRRHIFLFETIRNNPLAPSINGSHFSSSVCNPRTFVHRTSVTRCVVTVIREREIERLKYGTQWKYEKRKEKDEETKRRVQVPRVVETHRQTVGETGGAAKGSGLKRAREKGTCSRHAAEGRLVGVGERGVSVCVRVRALSRVAAA